MSSPINILSKFRSYSYYHVIALCDRTSTADALIKSTNLDVWQHPPADGENSFPVRTISADQTGDGQDGNYVILINGSTDSNFIITNAKWVGATAAEATAMDYGTSCAMEGTINVVEPRGILFSDQIVLSCLALGVDSSNVVWVMKTFFVGYPDDSQQVEYISDVTPIQFVVYDLVGEFTEAGGSYELSFVAWTNGASRLPQYGKAVDGVTFSPGAGRKNVTVHDAMTTLFEKIRERYDRHVNCVRAYVDRSVRNLAPEDKAAEVERYYQVYYQFDNEGSDYKDDDYVVVDQPAQFKDDPNCFAPPTMKAPSSIEDAIHMIMQHTPKAQQEMVDGVSLAGSTESQKQRYEYKIVSSVEIKYGKDSNQPTAFVTYQIKRFPVPKDISIELLTQQTAPNATPNEQQLLVQQNTIEFDYMYSGKNIDVLAFDMKLNFGLAYLQTATMSNTFKQQADALPQRSTHISRFINQTRRYEDGTAVRKSRVPIFFGTQIRNPSLNNSVDQINKTQAAYTMSKHASLEVSEATMKIMGNPRILGSLNRTSGSDGVKQVDPSKINLQADPTSTAFPHWTSIPAYAKVHVYMPTTNDDLALAQQRNGNYSKKFWYDGYYYVYAVEHEFIEGNFTQTLHMFGIPQSSDRDPLVNNSDSEQNFDILLNDCLEGGSVPDLNCVHPSTTRGSVSIPQHNPGTTQTPMTTGERLVASSWSYQCQGPELVSGWPNAPKDVQKAILAASQNNPVINGQATCTAQFLAAISRLESKGWQASIKSPLSSATGLYQFLNSTWDGLYASYGTTVSQKTNIPLPAKGSQQWYDLRKDPTFCSYMATYFVQDNIKSMTIAVRQNGQAKFQSLVDMERYGGGDLYMAHVLGAGGAGAILKAIYHGEGDVLTVPQAYDKYCPSVGSSGAVKAINSNPYFKITLQDSCNNARVKFCFALYQQTTDKVASSLSPQPQQVAGAQGTNAPSNVPLSDQTFAAALTPCQVTDSITDKSKTEVKPDITRCDASTGRVLSEQEQATSQQRQAAAQAQSDHSNPGQ